MKTKAKLDLSKFCENKDTKEEAILEFFGFFYDTDKFDDFEDLVLIKKEKAILDYINFKGITFKENR